MARALMVQGTASGVGKSLITAALCRIFARQGLQVAPFKAQNMSNNAAVTIDGGEIGRAQALQAQAARVQPNVRMNPILLKPLSETSCDVVVLGKSRPELRTLPWHERKAVLWSYVTSSLDQLLADVDLLVIEGAGSPAETNLRRSDIVNMAVARHLQAPVLLVADIDRGGAFAALYGTWALLAPADRALLRGFILNRFRGDARLLEPAPAELHLRTGIPVIGVVPYLRHCLPDEDAFTMRHGSGGAIPIAAIRLPHIANFDDLDPITIANGVHVQWTVEAAQVEKAAAIIIPGTRNTMADLRWLWQSGLAAAIRASAARGVQVVGLCGGYQMLGHRVSDPHGIEGGGVVDGLGLLSISTELLPGKHTQQTAALTTALPFEPRSNLQLRLQGYEIHHGHTLLHAHAESWLQRVSAVQGGSCDQLGARAGSVWGTYLHGIFANDEFRAAWLRSLGAEAPVLNWSQQIEQELDRLADTVAAALDRSQLDALLEWQAT